MKAPQIMQAPQIMMPGRLPASGKTLVQGNHATKISITFTESLSVRLSQITGQINIDNTMIRQNKRSTTD
jgi:hypothetical protein